MKRLIKRIKEAVWTFNQPLTNSPSESQTTISDLFIWRNSNSWQTYFELMDFVNLFTESMQGEINRVDLCLFSCDGKFVARHSLALADRERSTLSLAQYLESRIGEYGSFSLFHSHTPECISTLGSFIAERGYTGYRYGNSPLLSYVHGNLDAIAKSEKNEEGFQMLGSTSLLPRVYRLQCEIFGPATYEICMVNPTSQNKNFECVTISLGDESVIGSEVFQIPSRGTHIVAVRPGISDHWRIEIKSHLVMARPLVFRTNSNQMDVFHG